MTRHREPPVSGTPGPVGAGTATGENGPMEPQEMTDAVAASMLARTGRTLEQWVAVVEAEGPDPLDQKAVRAFLKQAHGIAQNSQWAIAFAVAEKHGWRMPTVEQFTDELYSGKKAVLRPLHDAVVAEALDLGDDVEVQGRATYIPVVRATQLAAIAPGPRTTLRVGLRLRGEIPDDERLAAAKGFAQATHWLHLPADAEPQAAARSLRPLLHAAYEQNGR